MIFTKIVVNFNSWTSLTFLLESFPLLVEDEQQLQKVWERAGCCRVVEVTIWILDGKGVGLGMSSLWPVSTIRSYWNWRQSTGYLTWGHMFFFLPQFYLNSPDRMLLFKGHTTLAQWEINRDLNVAGAGRSCPAHANLVSVRGDFDARFFRNSRKNTLAKVVFLVLSVHRRYI